MSRDEFWFWFGVWTSPLALVIAGTVTFTGPVPAPPEPKIVKICVDLFAINNAILTAAKLRGYIVDRAARLVPEAATVAKVLIAAFVLSMFLAGGSQRAEAASAKLVACAIPFDPLKLCGVSS